MFKDTDYCKLADILCFRTFFEYNSKKLQEMYLNENNNNEIYVCVVYTGNCVQLFLNIIFAVRLLFACLVLNFKCNLLHCYDT